MSIAIHSATAAPMYESIVTRSLPHRVDVLHHQEDEAADRYPFSVFPRELGWSPCALPREASSPLRARVCVRYASSSFPSATAR